MIVGQVGDARSSVKAKRQHEKYVGEHEPASNVSDQNEEDSGQKMREYRCAFTYSGESEDILPLQRITGPTEKEAEDHPEKPGKGSCDPASGQFES